MQGTDWSSPQSLVCTPPTTSNRLFLHHQLYHTCSRCNYALHNVTGVSSIICTFFWKREGGADRRGILHGITLLQEIRCFLMSEATPAHIRDGWRSQISLEDSSGAMGAVGHGPNSGGVIHYVLDSKGSD